MAGQTVTATPDNVSGQPLDLFGDQALAAYEEGRAAELILRRNREVGNLLLAERAVLYVQVLYRLLLFRRAHELEPLHEDLYDAVRPAQGHALGGAEYDPDQFRNDLAQLEGWGLVSCRIEVERLRGYRDSRRRKFRYRLGPDAVSFLEWLEERAQSDLYRPEEDARDLLEETSGSLTELLRLLRVAVVQQAQEGDVRRIVYQLAKLDALSLEVNGYLGGFNARLLGFVAHEYRIADARGVLRDLEQFVDGFLRQVHDLRGAIGTQVDVLMQTEMQDRVRQAALELDAERRRTPGLLRRGDEFRHPETIPLRLWEFFRADGRLDLLCRYIRESAMRVWRKLHAHLRELERRSTRIQDIRARCVELAALPEPVVPHRFMRELLAPAVMLADPHFWDESERAEPPPPRRQAGLPERPPLQFIRPKRRQGGPVVSLEQARLEQLGGWLHTTLSPAEQPVGAPLSRGVFTAPADFGHIMELSKAGLLDAGRRLRRVGYALTPDPAHEGRVGVDEQTLSFTEMTVRRLSGDAARPRNAP
jgi:hypothetical protein